MGGARYPQCGGQSSSKYLKNVKIRNRKWLQKMEKTIFLPCAHSASSLFILATGHTQRRGWIQAVAQDINGGVANCREYKN